MGRRRMDRREVYLLDNPGTDGKFPRYLQRITSRRTEGVIMGRNEGLPVSYLAEALLDVRPFEEPSAAPSRFPRQGRTPVYQGGDLCVCTGGSRPTLFPSLLQRDTCASYCWSSELAIARCLGMYRLGRLHNEQLHSTMPRTLARLQDWLASDSVPYNATLPTSAADPADRSSIGLARHGQSSCGPRSNKTHNGRAYASWKLPTLPHRRELQSSERDWT